MWEKWWLDHEQEAIENYLTLLRFQTVSAQMQSQQDHERCATFLSKVLTKAGFAVETWRPDQDPLAPPAVFAEFIVDAQAPTLLIYHHYDVQPVDPLSLWQSDPFEPVIKNGAVYARGAQDNKGQCAYTLAALSAFHALVREKRINVKVIIEGEEEIGSPKTEKLVQLHAKKLRSDYFLAIDAAILDENTPSITLGARGIVIMEVVCQTADSDMHSGGFGGIAYNAARALTATLASLWDESGTITVKGFYDGVREYTKEELAHYDLHVNPLAVQRDFGIRAFCPEPGYSIGESSTIRPTLEINGMQSGYTGEGFKTVLPAKAFAKISARLVPNQDPQKVSRAIARAIQERMPKGIDCSCSILQATPAFSAPVDSFLAKEVAASYEKVYGKRCVASLNGGSIPMMGLLAKISGAETVCMGMGLYEDQIHAPNEHFGLDRFKKGFLVVADILDRLNCMAKHRS